MEVAKINPSLFVHYGLSPHSHVQAVDCDISPEPAADERWCWNSSRGVRPAAAARHADLRSLTQHILTVHLNGRAAPQHSVGFEMHTRVRIEKLQQLLLQSWADGHETQSTVQEFVQLHLATALFVHTHHQKVELFAGEIYGSLVIAVTKLWHLLIKRHNSGYKLHF